MFELGLIAGVVLFLLWKAREMYFRVEENQVGLVLRFGAARHGADGKLLLAEPGLHFKWPWEEVRIVSLREQMLTLGVRRARRARDAQRRYRDPVAVDASLCAAPRRYPELCVRAAPPEGAHGDALLVAVAQRDRQRQGDASDPR
jgi:hypothetical protein